VGQWLGAARGRRGAWLFAPRWHRGEPTTPPCYRRAYENRLEADGEVMSALYKLWRMARASADPGLIARFQFIGDWIDRHHGHGDHAAAAPVREPAPAPAAGNGSSGAGTTGSAGTN
jgi:hypothetical protein